MGGDQLLERTKTPASEFSCHGIGPRRVRVHYSDQPYTLALLGKLMVNTGVVATKGAHADDRDVSESIVAVVSSQLQIAGRPVDLITKARWLDRALSSRSRLLQQCDLACMVKLVLDDPTEQVEKVVITLGLAWNLLVQARIREGSDRRY